MDALPQQSAAWNPPPLSELPAELREPKPRTIPDSVHESRLGMRRRNVPVGCLIAGCLCIGFSFFPFIKTLSLYILPMAYLLWIGLALCALGIFNYLFPREFKKACRYIEDGDAAFGRVTALLKTPTVIYDGQPTMHALVAQVEVQHPVTGERLTSELKSRDFSSASKNDVRTMFRVGDFVPIVWLANEFEQTLQVYDFLEISPDHTILYEKSKPTPLYHVLLLVLLLAAFFLAIFGGIYADGRFHPLEFDYGRQGLIQLVAGGVLGLLALAIGFYFMRRETKKVEQRNLEAAASGDATEIPYRAAGWRRWMLAVLIPPGAVLLGGGTVLIGCFTANALLDKSPPKSVPVSITEMIQTTHSFLIREYTMKYRRAGDKSNHSMLTTPEHLDRFAVPLGIAEVREGWLGWPWVEAIEPVVGQP
jgi:hypothetical protein